MISEIYNTPTHKKTTTYTTINQKLKSSVLTKGLDRAKKALALEQLREPLNLLYLDKTVALHNLV